MVSAILKKGIYMQVNGKMTRWKGRADIYSKIVTSIWGKYRGA